MILRRTTSKQRNKPTNTTNLKRVKEVREQQVTENGLNNLKVYENEVHNKLGWKKKKEKDPKPTVLKI